MFQRLFRFVRFFVQLLRRETQESRQALYIFTDSSHRRSTGQSVFYWNAETQRPPLPDFSLPVPLSQNKKRHSRHVQNSDVLSLVKFDITLEQRYVQQKYM
jgi:hypothetical protein